MWRIRCDLVRHAASPLDPENRRAVWIQACERDWLVESGADKNELLVRRDHDHGGYAVSLAIRIDRVPFRARRELAFGVNRHQPEVIGAERVQYEECAGLWRIGQRLGGAAPSFDRIAGGLDVHQGELAAF